MRRISYLRGCGTIRKFIEPAENKRGAWQNHKRLSYISINLYRTSLDHLLLGKAADIDENVDCPDYKTICPNGP